ncbi:MAG: DUF4870 domain-containing protein [Armatimonadota bacterium]|jgi:uncharacterized Tic20 family protein
MSIQPPIQQMNQQDERLWGMFCHLSALSGFIGVPFGAILGPLIVWLIKKDSSQFVDQQGKSSLNFQISILLYEIIPILVALGGLAAFTNQSFLAVVFVPIAALLIIALGVFCIIEVIIASIAARDGRTHIYPLSIKFIN